MGVPHVAAPTRINSYGKPGLILQTLEGLLGDETMTRIMRTYARRYRFAHPTTADFIAVVNEVTGKDYRWFFDETFFSSGLVDYAVGVDVAPVRTLEGWAESEAGPLRLTPAPRGQGQAEGALGVEGHGAGGWARRASPWRCAWISRTAAPCARPGTERTRGSASPTRTRPRSCGQCVDPDGKIALDVDRGNNAWIAETGFAERAATKWAARWMFWLQNLLELHLLLG